MQNFKYSKNNFLQLLLALLQVLAHSDAVAKPSITNEELKKKYPHSMLTPDYGIISDFDLADDAKTYKMKPYNTKDLASVNYWQCLPTKNITNKYETWRDSDPLGAVTSIITLCLLNTVSKGTGDWHTYVHRRAHPVKYCRDFVKNWKKITKDEPIVCLGGESVRYNESVTKNGVTHPMRLWVWNKFKTKKGCYSYFGNCER